MHVPMHLSLFFLILMTLSSFLLTHLVLVWEQSSCKLTVQAKTHVIAFASRALAAAEKNYSVTHLEILAVVWGLEHFRDIIMGYKITVYTGHSPIMEIFKGRNLNSRLARWYLTIQAYSPEIEYAKGRQNVLADALSRSVYVGAVTDAPPIPNFSMEDLVPLSGNITFGRK